MPGLAKTNDFMLGTATVMLGAPEDVFDLNPLEHSIGLVKNFTIMSEPAYTELTQGLTNTVVHSLMTSNPVRATMEAYEYTAKNLSYALGLDGADQVAAKTTATTTSSFIDGGSPSVTSVPVVSATGITADSYIMIKLDTEDHFIIRKVTNVVSNTLTVDKPIQEDIALGSAVVLVNMIAVGKKEDQPFYSAAIAGKLANGEAVVLLIAKLRIVKGFSMAFTTENYGNLPLEFTIYDLVNTDSMYDEFDGAQTMIFRK